MKQIKTEVDQLVSLGKEYIIRGQYERAYDSYNQALEYDPEHYLIRNALAEVYFIQKEFLSAADNFWLAAIDQSNRVDLDLINNNNIKDSILFKRKQKAIKESKKLTLDYAQKSGLALFADQYEDPLKKNTQQALINLYRHQIDPCGYSGYVDADLEKIARVEKNVTMIGYRFLRKMNLERLDSLSTPPLEELLDLFEIT